MLLKFSNEKCQIMGEDLAFHDEIELEDFEWDEELEGWTYPCPCGDRFVITQVGFNCF